MVLGFGNKKNKNEAEEEGDEEGDIENTVEQEEDEDNDQQDNENSEEEDDEDDESGEEVEDNRNSELIEENSDENDVEEIRDNHSQILEIENDKEEKEAGTENLEEVATIEEEDINIKEIQEDNPPKAPTPQRKQSKQKKHPSAAPLNCFAKPPEVEVKYELRAMSARLLDRAGNKISLDLVLIWPCDVLTVKRKVAAQAGLTNTNFILVLSAFGRLKDGDQFPEEGLHTMPQMNDENETKLAKLIRIAEEEKKEKDRKENPPYFCSAWAVLPGLLPGFKDAALVMDDVESGAADDDQFDDDSSMWSKSKRSNSMKTSRSSKAKTSKKKNKHGFDNTTSIGTRKKYFDLEHELSTINCEDHTAAVASLGVSEFSSFATLTVKELMVPGLGVPRPAARRIAELAEVYQRQMDAEDEEREAAALRARQGRLKKKRQQFNEDVEEDMSLKEVEAEDDDSDRGRFTVDGKFFFTSMKELKQVWGEAALVHRANLDDQNTELSLAETEQHADFSSVDGYHTDDLDSVVPPPPPPLVTSTEPTEPDANILDDYMRRLLRPATPEPPPPIELRPHRARTNVLMANIRRRTAWDEEYEVPAHMDAQHRPRLACCPKHAIRSKFWRTSKGRDLRRAVANEVDVTLSAATKEGHGYIGGESLCRVTKEVLDMFQVFIDPRDEDEVISRIVLDANPHGEVLGFSQQSLVESITKLVVKQFQFDNPILEFDINAANRNIRQKDIEAKKKSRALSVSNSKFGSH